VLALGDDSVRAVFKDIPETVMEKMRAQDFIMLFEMFDGDIVRAKECISFPEVA
jgi:hypothetical protein